LLDCRSLRGTSIPLNLTGCHIVTCDSRVRHDLAYSEYNNRRMDCERSVEILKSFLPGIQALRDISIPEFDAHRSVLPERLMRRSRHVISENERALKAAEALSKGNLKEVGRLMSASHASLRDDYEVSCCELDWLVESAQEQPGVLGTRMTGGGFGGCTVSLVEDAAIDRFKEKVSADYRARTNISPEIFVVDAGEGAGEIFY
jgi:galactokinase